MSDLILNIDVIAGSEIKDVLKEAKEKARFLGVRYVKFKFNTKTFCVSQYADIDKLLKEYFGRKSKNFFCS